MKIAFDGRVLTHKKKTGVQIHAKMLYQELNKLVDIKCFTPRYNNKLYLHFWEHLILPIVSRKHDILFCPSNVAPVFMSKSTKLVVTLHDLAFMDFSDQYSNFFQKYYSLLIPKVVKNAYKVVTVSNFSKNRIIKEFPEVKDKLEVIYHGVSNAFFFDKSIKKCNYILYVGAMNEIKNFQSVIKAFNQLKHVDIELKMIMPVMGTFSSNKEVDLLIANAKINKKIEIIDFVDQDKLKKIYQKAKLFIFPSFHESFGLPPLEAMACGTPVIVSNIGALPEVCSDSVLYIDPYNVDDIVKKMEILLSDEDLQKKLVETGLNRVKQFSWQNSAKEHIKVFEEVLKS
jgi:glycosyltransferase involved in cell wall biosynthesis